MTNIRYWAGGGLAALAVAAAFLPLHRESAPQPPETDLVLRGLFVGEHAADDAATLAALTGSLADCIEWDGTQSKPRLTLGLHIEELRTAAREARCNGVSIGARQPKVRDAIQAYLDSHAGKSAGPLTQEQRTAWSAAFREISRAAASAVR